MLRLLPALVCSQMATQNPNPNLTLTLTATPTPTLTLTLTQVCSQRAVRMHAYAYTHACMHTCRCVLRELFDEDDEGGVAAKEQLGGAHANAEKAWENYSHFVRGQGSFAPPLEQAAGSAVARLGKGRS